jgi:hypothetical protein
MTKIFALILYVANPAGEYSSFVIDYDLSATDCAVLHAQWEPTLDEFSSVECFTTDSDG